jgi:hypothetical protein
VDLGVSDYPNNKHQLLKGVGRRTFADGTRRNDILDSGSYNPNDCVSTPSPYFTP